MRRLRQQILEPDGRVRVVGPVAGGLCGLDVDLPMLPQPSQRNFTPIFPTRFLPKGQGGAYRGRGSPERAEHPDGRGPSFLWVEGGLSHRPGTLHSTQFRPQCTPIRAVRQSSPQPLLPAAMQASPRLPLERSSEHADKAFKQQAVSRCFSFLDLRCAEHLKSWRHPLSIGTATTESAARKT